MSFYAYFSLNLNLVFISFLSQLSARSLNGFQPTLDNKLEKQNSIINNLHFPNFEWKIIWYWSLKNKPKSYYLEIKKDICSNKDIIAK